MTDKKDPNENVLNPRLLVFPQDNAGFLYKLKNEVLKSIERQNGNQEKHEALMGTLAVLYKFAKRRYEAQAETRAAAVAQAAEAVEVPDEGEQPSGGDHVKQDGQSEPGAGEGQGAGKADA